MVDKIVFALKILGFSVLGSFAILAMVALFLLGVVTTATFASSGKILLAVFMGAASFISGVMLILAIDEFIKPLNPLLDRQENKSNDGINEQNRGEAETDLPQ